MKTIKNFINTELPNTSAIQNVYGNNRKQSKEVKRNLEEQMAAYMEVRQT